MNRLEHVVFVKKGQNNILVDILEANHSTSFYIELPHNWISGMEYLSQH